MSTLEGKTREEKLSILDDILRRGLRELCTHARDRNFLTHPYGRKPDPTPLITEEQFIHAGGLQCDDMEPDFKYDYGFDPLQFLGQYIVWAHPDSVRERQEAKLAAQDRLNKRANHAKTQLDVQGRLKHQVQKLRAGIQWGPLTVPLSCASLRCFVKPFKHGILYLQLSDREDFSVIAKTHKMYMKKPSTSPEGEEQEDSCSVRFVDFVELEEKKKYFIRCMAIVTDEFPPIILPKGSKAPTDRAEVKETDADFEDIQQLMANSYVHKCTTIPEETMNLLTSDNNKKAFHPDAKALANVRFLGQVPVEAIMKSKSNDECDLQPSEQTPTYACILGDLLQHSNPPNASVSTESYLNQLQVLLGKLSQRKELKESSFLLAWRDSHVLSSQYLKQEEQAFKVFRHDVKKYNKKHGIDEKGKRTTSRKSKDQLLPPPPTLKRPQPSPMFSALLQALPITPLLEDNDVNQSCRMLYRTMMLGSEVQLILLDMRRMQSKASVGCDYLGKEQAEWLQYILENSNATWKIIACGKAFGVCSVEERVKTAEPDFEEEEVEIPGVPESKANEDAPENDAVEGEEVARVSTATKQVQMVVSESELQRAKEKKVANLYEDCEETFGRSKFSLQHILSKFHTKADVKEKTVVIDEGADLDKQLFVRSGIVLMTGGVASSWIKYHFEDDGSNHDDFLTASSMIGKVEDKATPPFCAAYYHLSSPISEPISLTRTPSSANISTSSKQIPYCVELSLGNGTNVADFQYLQGLDAKTYYFPNEQDVVVGEDRLTECELSILEDGSLKVQLVVQPVLATQEKQVIFEKWLTIPTMHGDESDDQSGSVYVA